MHIAWPELIVLIVVGTLCVLGGEIGIIVALKAYRVSAWVAAPFALAMMIFDLWAALRVLDWLFAGPARRAKWRVM